MDTPAPPARPETSDLAPSDPPAAPDYYAALKPRHQRFVDAYVANGGNGAQAYITAGYSPDSAAQNASHLLANDHTLSQAITVKQADLSARSSLTRDAYVADLKAIVDADGAAMVDPESFLPTNPHTWPLALRQLISGIEVSEHESEMSHSRVLKVRLSDRLKARELLGKALGFFTTTEDSSKFELHINLSQSQQQAQVQATEPHDYGPLTVHLPKPQP